MKKPQVLMISKPIVPPWHDSGKNLVRDIALGLSTHQPVLMTPDVPVDGLGDAVLEPVYGKLGQGAGYAPALQQNAKVFGRLMRRRGESLRHFFFAPNQRTSTVGRVVSRLHRKVPTVQTVMSVPLSFDAAPSLMFTDAVVTLSQYTQDALQARGIEQTRLIYPGVDMSPAPRAPAGDDVAKWALREQFELPRDKMVFTFAGDYQFSQAAHVVASAVEQLFEQDDVRQSICVVFACRIKQALSRSIEAGIRARLSKWIDPQQLVFLNEVPAILDLLAASDVVMLPADSTYAKMDIPLVLVEAMREERPVIVADAGPLPEIVGEEAVGLTVEPRSGSALAAAMSSYIKQPKQVIAHGKQARLRATRMFDARLMAPAYEALYEELLVSTR